MNEIHNDPFDLSRFERIQQGIYSIALRELEEGRKRSHWMWFIFPQIAGLGKSATSVYYSIKSLDEARAYLDHPRLGSRIIECCEALLKVQGRSASMIFGYPDDIKLQSSMTLFLIATGKGDSVFEKVLIKYFGSVKDQKTIRILDDAKKNNFK